MVIHAAATVGGIGANREQPRPFFYENAIMGIQLIEACRRHAVEKTVVLGTICAYPKFTPVPFREEDLWNGYPEETNAPYGIAKKALLVQCQAYRRAVRDERHLPAAGEPLRPARQLRPEILARDPGADPQMRGSRATRAREEIVLWGDGSPTREFLYVEDAAEGIVLAAERYDGAEPVNLGSGSEISIRDLARKIAALTGFAGRIVWDATQPNGQPRRWLDVTRAARELGFRARIGLDEGLRATIAWYAQRMESGEAGGSSLAPPKLP